MYINAVIGSESHTTSSGWAKLRINGKQVSYREADSKEFLTQFGDKHASWCDCMFEVKDGDKVSWEAGTNTGDRGSVRRRLNLEYIVSAEGPGIETEDLGRPASGAILRGRLRLIQDKDKESAELHDRLKKSL